MLEQKLMRKVLFLTFFGAGQCAALSSFRVGKIQLLQENVGFTGRNEKNH